VGSQPVHVLVVDDDERVAASVRRSLEYSGYRVSVAHDGPTAIAAVHRDRPALVVLDVMLPGIDGHGVARALRVDPAVDPMVLMLTARDATADRVAGLDAGADDYLVKPFSFSELLARIRALLRRPVLRTANKLATGNISMDLGSRTVTRGAQEIVLTPREFAVLEYLLRHPGQALSRSQIAERVWSWEFHGETNIVDVYIGYLRRKLDEAGTPSVIETLRGYGYRLKDEARCA
jgi:DNA-binding response OmpR family regulator